MLQGRPHDALSEIEFEHYDAVRSFLYAITYHVLGREKDSGSALSELIAKYPAGSAYQIAQVYAFENQPDKAFEWLDQAYSQHDGGLVVTKVDPLLKNLHMDPRFSAFLQNTPALVYVDKYVSEAKSLPCCNNARRCRDRVT